MYRVKVFDKVPTCKIPIRERADMVEPMVRLTMANVCCCEPPKDGLEGLCASADSCRIRLPSIRKKIPFNVPQSPYANKPKNDQQSMRFFVESTMERSRKILREQPFKDQENYLKDRLRRLECTPNSAALARHHQVRPPRILSNREIAEKIMRRKSLRERKCGDRLGPFNMTVQSLAPHGMFDKCRSEGGVCHTGELKVDPFQKNVENSPEENAKKSSDTVITTQKDMLYDDFDTNPTCAERETSVTGLEDYINDVVEVIKNPDEAIYMLDWHPKPTPCANKLKPRGECRGSEENIPDIECTCGVQFKNCNALNFLQRKDPFYKWIKDV